MRRAGGVEVDPAIQDALDAVRKLIAETNQRARSREELRTGSCVLLISGSDATARAFYREALAAGMRGPPALKPTMVTVFFEPYGAVLETACKHYNFETYAERRLDPDEVRVVVLTQDTFTVVRLDADSNVTACSPPLHASKRDVLVLATAHWRADYAEGLSAFYVPTTRARGDAFVSRCAALLAQIERAQPSQESIEEELRKCKLVNPEERREIAEERAAVFARVAWLERKGYLTVDDKNGVQFISGVESDLEDAEERARDIRAMVFRN
jgi:hypothetical protein